MASAANLTKARAILPRSLPRLAELLAEVRRRNRNKFDRMYPDTGRFRRELYPKHMQVVRATGLANQVAFIAGNKCGKSELGCYCVSAWATGRYPAWWDGRRFAGPTTIWIAGEKNSVVRDSLQYKLLGPLSDLGTGLIPGDAIARATRKSGLADAIDTLTIKHVSGGFSSIRFKSYEEGRKSFQATDVDVLMLDEEPPQDIWVEGLMRTMVKQGLALLTFTPLSGWSDVVEEFLGIEGAGSLPLPATD
jgi:phage terminase large subunit-like protein